VTQALLELFLALAELAWVCGLVGYVIAFEVLERWLSKKPALTTTQVREMLAPGLNHMFGKEP